MRSPTNQNYSRREGMEEMELLPAGVPSELGLPNKPVMPTTQSVCLHQQ